MEKIIKSMGPALTVLVIVLIALVIIALLINVYKANTQKTQSNEYTIQTKTQPINQLNNNLSITDEDEIMAVIAAAVTAFGVSAGKQLRIKQVKRVSSRMGWAMAGLLDNTSPF